MFLRLVFCNILLITFTVGDKGNVTAVHTINNTTLPTNQTHVDGYNKTKLAVVSEGGSVISDNPHSTLLKDSPTSLMSLDDGLGKTKVKSVVARKGVGSDANVTSAENTSPLSKENETKEKVVAKDKINNVTKSPETNNNVTNKPATANITDNTTKIVKKKPLILSSDALEKIDYMAHDDPNVVAVKSTSNTPINGQISSPINANIKTYQSKTDSRPEIVMPVVITILVVPMFAIIGYLAFKRGREAWKNRHYKRMDFLLDGMYND